MAASTRSRTGAVDAAHRRSGRQRERRLRSDGPSLGGAATYILPIKAASPASTDDLTDYLRWLSSRLPVLVVDGSRPRVFAAHDAAWSGFVRHLPVTSRTPNGKVAGVLDGVAAARTPYIVLADDDVRYDERSLTAVISRLAGCSAIVPQNYFDPRPWHAHWDTGRTLVNRAFGSDYAGTLALRRQSLVDTGGYCGNVLFENLELLRTLAAHGFGVCHARDIFVVRRPPSARDFAGQRVRQAYDSRAQPARMAFELMVLPVLLAGLRWRHCLAAALLASTVAVAEIGRRRDRGQRVFDRRAPLWAPAWLAERGVTSWLTVMAATRGGVRYGDGRLARAAHAQRDLVGTSCPAPCVCVTPWRQGGQARAA